MEFEIERIIRDLTPEEIEKAKNGDKSITYTQLGLSINGRTYMYDKPVKCCDPVTLFRKKSEGYVFKNEEYELIYSEMSRAIEKAEYNDHSIYFSDADSITKQIIEGRVKFKDIKYSELMKDTNSNEFPTIPPFSPSSKREELDKKVSNFKISERAKKWIAGGIAGICLLGAGHYLGKYIVANNANSSVASATDIDTLDINNVKEFQNDFNTRVATEIYKAEDKNAKLFIDSDEALALYVYANCKTLSPEQIAKYFGNTEALLASNLTNNKDEAEKVLIKAYYCGANPTVENLFLSKSNAKLYEEIENLYLACYKEPTNENKKALNDKFREVYLADNGIKERNPEAAGCAGKIFVTLANINNWLSNDLTFINEKGLKQIAENLQKSIDGLNCNLLKESIEEISTISLVEKVNNDVLNYLKENAVDGNRNIDLGARDSIINNNSTTKADASTTKPEIIKETTTHSYEQITESEARKDFGNDAVEKAEEKAEEAVDNNDANKKADAYEKGLRDVYNAIYNKAITMSSDELLNATSSTFNDVINSVKNSYNGSYGTEYSNGISNGVTSGMNEVVEMQNQLKKALATPEVKTTLEESASFDIASAVEASIAEDSSDPVRTR